LSSQRQLQKSKKRQRQDDDDNDDDDDNRSPITVTTLSLIPTLKKETTNFIRSVPHTIGNWAGRVFLPIPMPFAPTLARFANVAIDKWNRKLLLRPSDANPPVLIPHDLSTFHISLSRPFYLTLASIEPFISRLKSFFALENKSLVVAISDESEILVNDDKTRSFVTLPVVSGEGGW
jgi:hypothetical protein